MFKKALLVLSLFGMLDFSCIAMFKKGDECKIVSGYLVECEETIIIDGTCRELFGVRDIEAVMENEKLWNNPSLANYLSICLRGIDDEPCLELVNAVRGCGARSAGYLKQDCRGVFYYGKLKESGRGFCLNPVWLKKIEENV